MRPHRLVMRAFGPFADEVVVDLDRLSAGGLFLLHGETGAGKTTLLDGLGFALFGRVPGARGATGRLRSDHAAPDVRTVVQLEVTLGGRRWRITRSPQQERAKARGTGTTTEQAKVLLEEQRGGAWHTVSTRIDEASAELDPLLGMSAEQFFQVVLLPQGEFARFLRARNEDRAALLQRLFGTERFRAVEDWLAARRVATSGAVATARQDVQVLEARLAQAAGLSAPGGPGAATAAPQSSVPQTSVPQLSVPEAARPATAGAHAVPDGEEAAGALRGSDDVEGSDDLEGLLRHVREVAEGARREVDRRGRAREAARVAAEQARELAERQARLRGLHRERAQLERERPAHDALGTELAAAGRAAELVPVLDDAARRERAHAAATSAEAQARAQLAGVGLPVAAGVPALRAAAAASRARAGRLEGLRGPAADLAAERDGLAHARRDVLASAEAADTGRRLLQELPARLAEHRAVLDAARAAAERLPHAEHALAGLRAALLESAALRASDDRHQELRELHLLARETHVSLRDKESELRDARLTSMVAELADRLEDGAPCEVCGSLQHPDPYEGASDGVTRDDEDRARLAAEEAGRRVDDLAQQLAAEDARGQALRTRLAAAGHEGPAAALETALAAETAQAERELDGLRRPAAGVAPALARVEEVERALSRGAADLERLVAVHAAAARRCEEAQERTDRLAARLADELEGAPDFETALLRMAATAQVCEAVLEAVEQAARAGAEAVRAGADAAGAAAAGGFPDAAAARAAVRPPGAREAGAARRRAYDDRWAAVAAALADPDLQVPLEPPADVAAATAARDAADRAVDVAVSAAAAAGTRAEQVGRLVPQVQAARDALVPRERTAAQVRALADLCAGAGGNVLRMSLSSFVLAARLEEVAQVASTRLLRMTQGRYSLAHTDGAARRGARSGLGLLVRDTWTGEDRDVSTLSGGESFQASLALALGLADVVQAEAGGTRIDSLFIDEGFGTLDEQTLDEVMDVLDGLREGGRVVGLVSHVAELRTRIPAQVQVHKGRTGSQVTLLGC